MRKKKQLEEFANAAKVFREQFAVETRSLESWQ